MAHVTHAIAGKIWRVTSRGVCCIAYDGTPYWLGEIERHIDRSDLFQTEAAAIAEYRRRKGFKGCA